MVAANSNLKKYSQSDNTEDLCRRFLKASQRFSEYGNMLGIRITAASDYRLPIFRKLFVSDQACAVEKLELNLDIFSSVVASGGNLGNSSTMAWFGCQKLGYVPPSDFFDKITNDDVIQVYSVDGVHRFANLKFFEICSYTLEQLYSLPWPLLWKRDENEMSILMGYVSKIFAPDHKGTLEVLGPEHIVTETSSPFKYETKYHMRHMAPLTDRETQQKTGMIVAEGVILEGPILTASEEESLLRDFYLKQGNEVSLPDLTIV